MPCRAADICTVANKPLLAPHGVKVRHNQRAVIRGGAKFEVGGREAVGTGDGS